MNYHKGRKQKTRTYLVLLLELLILMTACCCLFSIAGKTAKRHAEKKAQTMEVQERQADLGKWNLILVNPWNPIPEGFEVTTAEVEPGYSVDERVKEHLEDMLSDCRDAGCSPVLCSAFRSHETQQKLYDREAQPYLAQGMDEEEAYEKAGESVAVPGTSEHECGLAVDIIDKSYQVLDDKQEETETQKWLMEHCQDYGFILRYPNDKKGITGIIYEPWHYRYVGEKHAKVIMDKGICLEEYLDMLGKQ